MPDNDLLTPERLEEIRATLVKRLADERRRAKKDGTQPYQTVVSMAEGDDMVTALALIAAQAEQIQELTAQRDHYHTEWTARGTALLQLHQDIEAEKRKGDGLAGVVKELYEKHPRSVAIALGRANLEKQPATLITPTPYCGGSIYDGHVTHRCP